MYRQANRVMFQRITRAAAGGKIPVRSTTKRNTSTAKVDKKQQSAFGKSEQQPKIRQQLNRSAVVTQLGGAISQAVFLDLLLFGALDDDGT